MPNRYRALHCRRTSKPLAVEKKQGPIYHRQKKNRKICDKSKNNSSGSSQNRNIKKRCQNQATDEVFSVLFALISQSLEVNTLKRDWLNGHTCPCRKNTLKQKH